MGCCLSRSTTTNPPPPNPNRNLQNYNFHRRNLTPPPVAEEESVKEVLTETPIFVDHIRNDETVKKVEEQDDDAVRAEEEKTKEKLKQIGNVEKEVALSYLNHQLQVDQRKKIEAAVEIAEIEVKSEITEATESMSLSCVGERSCGLEKTTNKRGNEEVTSRTRAADVVRQQRTGRSPAKATKRRPYSGELGSGQPREKRLRSPAKRAVPSPEKPKAQHVPAQYAATTRAGRSQSPAAARQRSQTNVGPAKIRRDFGERSGRRSRSPGRSAFQNQNSSSSVVNRGGQNTEVNGGVNNSVNFGQREGSTSEKAEEEQASTAANESLENPLVSLECFIFL